MQGKADKLIEPDIAERLLKAAAGNAKVTVVYIEGADHGFSQQQPALVERVLSWIKSAVAE